MSKRMNCSAMKRERYQNTYDIKSEKVYHQYPIKVTRRFREGLVAVFPALENHSQAKAYRAMLEYILYASLRDEDGSLVVPAQTLASLVEAKVGQNGFRALDYLEGFSRDVFPLRISDYVPHKRARTITYEIPDAVVDLKASHDLFSDDKVWLVSGLPVTATSRRKAAARYEEDITYFTDGVSEDHPAYNLMKYLNDQPQTALGKRIDANWHRLIAMYEDMDESERKNSVGFVLLALQDWTKNFYAPSNRTSRISVRHVSVHSLPREMRKVALSGGMELDIRSSQAAIVAKMWHLPQMSILVASGTSFWEVMLEHLALSNDAKPALKTALYATCFGMGKRKLLRNLAEDVGRDKALAFFRHPLLLEVLAGRSLAMKRVREEGGITDAFGRWMPLSREFPAHCLLAIEAQSWELKLMLPIFHVVKDVDGLSILSWLHDGVVVYHRDTDRLMRLLNRAKQAFDVSAAAMGFPTDLEISRL